MYKDTVIDWKNWEEEIKEHYGIIHVKSLKEVRELQKNGSLLCSRCSKQKINVSGKSIPKYLYTGNLNRSFYRWCEFYNFNYAILSDKYGVIYDNEKVERYDKHPSTLEEQDFIKLAQTIKKKMKKGKYKSFTFYNTSPIMSKPYFYMMYLTGFPIYFITKLHINKINLGLKL